jgi:hypothetical protein
MRCRRGRRPVRAPLGPRTLRVKDRLGFANQRRLHYGIPLRSTSQAERGTGLTGTPARSAYITQGRERRHGPVAWLLSACRPETAQVNV